MGTFRHRDQDIEDSGEAVKEVDMRAFAKRLSAELTAIRHACTDLQNRADVLEEEIIKYRRKGSSK
jgi:hypothetical protein